MKTNLHRQLLRPKRAFLGLVGGLFYLNFFAMLVPASHRTDALAFQWWGLFIPLALGAVLAMVLHEPMHRPFAMTLPGASRRFFRSHLVVVGGAALLCALIAHWADRTLPVATVAGIAAAGLSLALPVEPGWRWAGSRGWFWAILAAALSAAAFPREVKDFVVAHPWIGGECGVALAAACFAVAFSPDRRRARASRPYTSMLTAMYAPEFKSQIATEALARQKISRTQWQPSLHRDSIVGWVRAVLHENFGQQRWGFARMFIFPLLFILIFSVVSSAKNPSFAERILQIVCPPSGRVGASFPMFMMFFMASSVTGLPRPEWLYPLSRARRAQVAFAASAWQFLVKFTLFIGGLLSAAWFAAHWAGLAFDLHAAARFAASSLLMIPFVPFAQWGQLHQKVRNDQAMAMLTNILAMLAAFLVGAVVEVWWTGWFSPGGLALWVLAIGASQLAYYAALRRFYREGDLLQRGTKRQNLSLI